MRKKITQIKCAKRGGLEQKYFKVYIILPVYNWEKYFLEQLISIYNQDYENRFLVIVNDGSTDSSEQIARNFVNSYNLQDKVLIVNKSNWWLNSAINRWFEEIKKLIDINNSDSLISYCDCDDVWTRNKLSVQVEYMYNHPECDLSYHDIFVIDENSKFKKKSKAYSYFVYSKISNKNNTFSKFALTRQTPLATTMMFRLNYLGKILPFPVWFDLSQDMWAAFVITLFGWSVDFIDMKLCYYREGHNSLQVLVCKRGNHERDLTFISYFEFMKKRFPYKDISSVYQFLIDKNINWYNKKYPDVLVYLLMLFNYPKIFWLKVKVYIIKKCIWKKNW